jgi:hypothetical protein
MEKRIFAYRVFWWGTLRERDQSKDQRMSGRLKAKITLEQAMRAQRRSRGIALLFL